MSAIDYYLTDEACAPAGSEGLFAERPWRIATPAYAYRPSSDMGEAGSLPAQQRGYITFGTLTRTVRINHRTIASGLASDLQKLAALRAGLRGEIESSRRTRLRPQGGRCLSTNVVVVV